MTTMKMRLRICLGMAACLVGAPAAQAQREPFSAYVLGLAAASSVIGTERMFALQTGTPKTVTPYQILSTVAGDCTIAAPPSIVCTKTGGASFAPSATTDTTNAGNIGSGTLNPLRLALSTAFFYVGNGSNNPAGVAMSGDCTLASTGAVTCTKTGGVAFAASATTDATNATNIGAGTLNTLRLPSPFTSGTRSGNTSQFMTGSGVFTNGHVIKSDTNGNAVDGGAAGSGTVTEQKNTFGYGLSSSGNCDNTSTNAGSPCNAAVGLTQLTNSLGADVALNNSTYSVGPTVSQGLVGTWFASGTVTLTDSAASQSFFCKLWDGTTIIASGKTGNVIATASVTMTLSGYLATPAANIEIRCLTTATGATSTMTFNVSGNSKDSTLTAFRIQ